MSVLLDRILGELVGELVREGQLRLVDGVDPEDLVQELRARMADAPAFSQAGPVLGAALTESELVDELYATDAEIVTALSALSG